MVNYLYFEKRGPRDGCVDLLGCFEYESYSVLAGQTGKQFITSANSEEELQKEADEMGLDVDVSSLNWFSKFTYQEASVPSCPPSDFDPAYAGERWDDDY